MIVRRPFWVYIPVGSSNQVFVVQFRRRDDRTAAGVGPGGSKRLWQLLQMSAVAESPAECGHDKVDLNFSPERSG